MNGKLIAACIQANAGPDIAENLSAVEPLILEAGKSGARLIALPENVSMMVKGRDKIAAQAKNEGDHPAIPFFAAMAQKTGAWIVGGSLAIAAGDGKFFNRCYLFNPEGNIAARYDKIHMFDADVGTDEKYRESETFRRGERAVVADADFGKLGLTICYDLRFPHLYRALAKAGAAIITAPAAFTATTGALHWHVLLRARAIETGAYILAPAQCGTHDGGRRTYGHSLIIDPLGTIVAEAGVEPGTITAELDLSKVDEARRMLPSLKHDCEFERPC